MTEWERERDRQRRLISDSLFLADEAERVIATSRRTIERTKELMRIHRQSRRQQPAAAAPSSSE